MAQQHIGADGLPTNDSTPAEKAATAELNAQIQANNEAVEAQAAQAQADYQAQVAANSAQAANNDAQYQAQQQQYQDQLQQNQSAQQTFQAAQQDYQERTRAYYDLRARYAAERAAYHRGVWPSRYSSWRVQSDARLVGSRVEIINGAHVGTVDYVVRTPSGRIDAGSGACRLRCSSLPS